MSAVPEAPLRGRRPSLHDVAAAAGVSHMTVSRVVRGARLVKPATLAKVRQAIARLGYRPDPALSALAAYRTRGGGQGDGSHLAFLDCDGTDYSHSVFRGARDEGQRHGYTVEAMALPPTPAGQRRLGRVLFHRGVRGLLFGPSQQERDFQGWNWPEFAAVSLGALAHRPALDAVAMDYFHGAFAGCRLLAERGCRRIAFLVEPRLESRTGHRWLGGYRAARDGREPIVYRGTHLTSSSIRRWCTRQRVDGLLTIHPEAVAAWPGPPAHLVYLGLDAPARPPCTHLALDPAALGMEGVRFLHHRLLNRELGLPEEPRMLSLQGRWIHPETTQASVIPPRRKGQFSAISQQTAASRPEPTTV